MYPSRFVPAKSFPTEHVVAALACPAAGAYTVWRGMTSWYWLVILLAMTLFFVGSLVRRLMRGQDTLEISAEGLRVTNRTRAWQLAWSEVADVSTVRQAGMFWLEAPSALNVQPKGAFLHKTVSLDGHDAHQKALFDAIAMARSTAYQSSLAYPQR